jgi:hypothetical protein
MSFVNNMNTKPASMISLLLQNQSEVQVAHSSFHDDIESLSLVVAQPSLLADNKEGIQSLASSIQSLSNLKQVRLSTRGVAKRDDAGNTGSDQSGSTCSADAVAEVVSALSSVLVSLEIAVPKLQGSVLQLAAAVQNCQKLERVVLHQCESSVPQGLLPILNALGQVTTLQSLTLEAIKFPVGDITAQSLYKLAGSASLESLEIKQCIDLGDEELTPLMSNLSAKLKHLKLSTGGLLCTPGHYQVSWGKGVVKAWPNA